MMKKKSFLIYLGLLCTRFMLAQSVIYTEAYKFETFKEAQENICLLKNENNMLPIRHLESKSIAYLTTDSFSCSIFLERMSDYTPVKVIKIVDNNGDYQSEDFINQLKSYDIIIGTINSTSFSNNHQSSIKFFDFFDNLSGLTKCVLVIFDESHTYNNLFDLNKYEALIYASHNSPEYQDASAQLLFGGISAKGKLRSEITPYFKIGHGLESEEAIRFKFTLPEEFGIDPDSLNHSVDSKVEIAIKNKAFPGCQLLAAKDGKVFFYKSYGFHTYDSLIPVKKDDLYDLASITKIVGPLPVLMKLYEEKKINLDSKFSDYWHSFKHSDKKYFTLREALAHQAGLPAWIPFWKFTLKKNGKFKYHTFKEDSSIRYPIYVTDHLWLYKNYDKKIFKRIKKTPLTGKIDYLYSDLGFHIYPRMIENITGENYEEYLSGHFYKPMGAMTINYNPLKKFKINNIIPTEMDTIFRKKLIHGTVHDEGAAMLGGVSGNAGLFSSTLDLAKIMQMYLNNGKYGGYQFLSPETIQEFTRCQFPENNNRRGLGFDKISAGRSEPTYVSKLVGLNSFGHTGFTGTMCWADPESGVLFIMMTNRVYPSRDKQVFFNLNVRANIHQVFMEAIKQGKSTD